MLRLSYRWNWLLLFALSLIQCRSLTVSPIVQQTPIPIPSHSLTPSLAPLKQLVPQIQVSTVFSSRSFAYPFHGSSITYPSRIAIDKEKNLYISHSIFKFTITQVPAKSQLDQSIFLGPYKVAETGIYRFMGSDENTNSSHLSFPQGLAISSSGTLYTSGSREFSDCVLKMKDTEKFISIEEFGKKYSHIPLKLNFLGAFAPITKDHESTSLGFKDGSFGEAQFKLCSEIEFDTEDNLYIVDRGNHSIRKLTPDGRVSTLAGTGKPGFADGSGTQAQFNNPVDVAVAPNGSVYVADATNLRVREIHPNGIVSTLAGNGNTYPYTDEQRKSTLIYGGFKDGLGSEAEFRSLNGITVNSKGYIYVTDFHAVREISPVGQVKTIAGSQEKGDKDGLGSEARFNGTDGIEVDQVDNLYVADELNHQIRKIIFSYE